MAAPTGFGGDSTVPCIIIPSGEASVFRQAKENTSRTGLNPVGMARQIALLLLAVHDIHPPLAPISHDFYRQALDLDLRGKREFTSDILSAMGGISRKRLSHFKALLGLSDEAIELADRHSVDEGKLRQVLRLPAEMQAEANRQIIQHNLDIKQIKQMIEEPEGSGASNETAPDRNTLQLARLIQAKDVPSIQEIA